MPYIVTTKRPAELPHGGHPDDYGYPQHVSRRAVATLETDELFRVLFDGNRSQNNARVVAQIRSLPESGGTVGPLPDGTVIKVERATWQYLVDRLYPEFGPSDVRNAEQGDETAQAHILDAYNARQS
jgi:hypothetical protein